MTHNNQRLRQHEHNGHKGRARMALQALNAIAKSETVTPETRELAIAAAMKVVALDSSLSTRINADGSRKTGLYQTELSF